MTDVHASLPPRYLRTPEAARFLGLSGRTLEKHRTFGTGPAYRKIGGRVVYRVEDLQRWADQGLRISTSDPGDRAGPRAEAGGTVIVPRPFPAILDGVRPRDAIDLMAWPCFSLAKRPRHTPMVHEYRGDFVRVTPSRGSPGLATIWDADILIWAVSQFAEAGDRRLAVSPALTAPAFQVLRFLGRRTGQSQYALLKAGLDRLAGAEVETSVAVPGSRSARFRWIEHWEQADGGLLLVLPEWLYTVVVERRRILRIDPGYFQLTGGTERWLWRLLRRHGQGKSTAWEIPLAALQARSGSLARPSDFIGDLRRIAHRRVLLGYALALVSERGQERLRIARSADPVHSAGECLGISPEIRPQNPEPSL